MKSWISPTYFSSSTYNELQLAADLVFQHGRSSNWFVEHMHGLLMVDVYRRLLAA